MERPRVGERVRERREALGMTQRALAAAAGLAHMRLNRLELGKVKRLVEEEVPALAAALEVPIQWLLGEDEMQPEAAAIVVMRRRARELSPEDRARVAAELSRLPRRPQARCAARPGEGDVMRRAC